MNNIKSITLISILIFLISCNNKNQDKIIGTWKGAKSENKTIDSFFIKSQILIDTIGKNNDDATNMKLYGIKNMDSLRKYLQLQHDSALITENNKIKNTHFIFKKDRTIELFFNGYNLTGKWNFDDEGSLILEVVKTSGDADLWRMKVITLNENELKLQFRKTNDTSIVTFNRASE